MERMDPLFFLRDEHMLMHIFSFLGCGKGQGVDTIHPNFPNDFDNAFATQLFSGLRQKVENSTTAMGPCAREILLLSLVSKGWKKVAEKTSFAISNISLLVNLDAFRDVLDARDCLNWLIEERCSIGSVTFNSNEVLRSYLPQIIEMLSECDTTNLMLLECTDQHFWTREVEDMVKKQCPNLLIRVSC